MRVKLMGVSHLLTEEKSLGGFLATTAGILGTHSLTVPHVFLLCETPISPSKHTHSAVR